MNYNPLPLADMSAKNVSFWMSPYFVLADKSLPFYMKSVLFEPQMM